MTYKSCSLLIFFTLIISSTALAQNKEDEQIVMSVVDQFMQAIDEKDTSLFNAVLIENAQAFVSQGNEVKTRKMKMLVDFPADQQWKERLDQAEIKVAVSEKIASVSAPYLFWINDQFSHCGYETFVLVKEKGSWKINSLTFSVEREDCQ